MKKIALPHVPEADQTAAVKKLLSWGEDRIETIHRLQEQVLHLKDEVAVLKGEKKRPKFKQSRMNEDAGKASKPDRAQNGKPAKRPGSAKKSKTGRLKIDCEEVIQPVEPIPLASRFKGYRDFVVQDLVIGSRNTRYRLARWQTPDGRTLTGQLPAEVNDGHFGAALTSYILYQHHHCQVTQPLLCEQLREWGIEISSGQVNALLLEGKDRFTRKRTDFYPLAWRS